MKREVANQAKKRDLARLLKASEEFFSQGTCSVDCDKCGQHIENAGDFPSLLLIAPYWSIVVPLTVFSAWLLIGKPRVAKLASASET